MNKILVAINPFLTDTSTITDCEFVFNPWGTEPSPDLIEEELSNHLYDGLIVGTKKVKNSITEKCPTLKVISRVGAGVDNVDIEHFKKNKVTTVYTPYGPTDSTAEQAVSLLLSGLKQIPQYNQEVKEQVWNRSMGKRLKDCTVGVVGTGRIGKRVVELLMPFGCKIMLFDEYMDLEFAKKTNSNYANKETILKECDILTFHVAYNQNTKNWISKEELDHVKNDIIIINAARGGIINEQDMADFLKINSQAIYCADVYTEEPYKGPLSELQNTILTPHVSTFTYGARIETEEQALENCLNILRGEHCEYIL